MATHFLKIWPQYYDMVEAGNKDWEIRKNDRNFKLGDIVILEQWDPETEIYVRGTELNPYKTKNLRRIITNVIHTAPGLKHGYVIFSHRHQTNVDKTQNQLIQFEVYTEKDYLQIVESTLNTYQLSWCKSPIYKNHNDNMVVKYSFRPSEYIRMDIELELRDKDVMFRNLSW